MQSRKNRQRRVWLLGGTGEGPLVAGAFLEQGWQVAVSVVSSHASIPYLEMESVVILIGPLDGVEGIRELLKRPIFSPDAFDLVVDATHPFAIEISSNLIKACQELQQPLIRFERPIEDSSGANVISESSHFSKFLIKGRNVLMAIGARYLSEAVVSARDAGANVFARVLPFPGSIRQALSSGIPESHLAILQPLQGSETGGYEYAICRRWGITDVLCRESGGKTQKFWTELCAKENIRLWLISRPPAFKGVETIETIEELIDLITKSTSFKIPTLSRFK